MGAKANVTNTIAANKSAAEKVERAVHKEDADKEQVASAKEEVSEKEKVMDAAKEKFDTAKQEYESAEKKLTMLTGVDKKKEKDVEGLKKSMQSAFEKTVGHLTKLDEAMGDVTRSAKAAKDAKAAEDEAQAKKTKLTQSLSETKKREEQAKQMLAQAVKAGNQTEHLEAAAKKAAAETEAASRALKQSAEELDSLKKETESKSLKAGEAKKKAEAMKKIIEAERTLVAKLGEREDEAKKDNSMAEEALSQQSNLTEAATRVATESRRNATQLNATLQKTELKLSDEQAALEKFTGIVKAEKENQSFLRKQHNEATKIDISSSTTAEEATKILDSKSEQLQSVTQPLLKVIAKEKKALQDKRNATEQVKQLGQKVDNEKMVVSTAQFNAVEANQTAFTAEKKLHAVQKEADTASTKLQNETVSKKAAETNLTAAKEKAKREDTIAEEAEKEEDKVEAIVKKAEEKATEEKNTAAKAQTDVAAANTESREDLTVVAPQPTPVPTTDLERVSTPTPVPTSPTPAPTTLIQKLMAPAPLNKCVNHKDWKDECPYLKDHCADFKAMKVFCKGTCEHCTGKINEDVNALKETPQRKESDTEKTIDKLIPPIRTAL